MTAASVAKNTLKVLDNKSPLILTGLAVAGLVSTTILAIRATPQALLEIRKESDARENRYRMDDVPVEVITKWEIVKLTWQSYIPTAGMLLVTGACMVGAQSVNTKRQAMLISGYTLTETAFREYREKAVEVLGKKPEQKLRDDLAAEKVLANPPSNQVFITGTGDVLCYDVYSGRYFMSDMETLRSAQNDINQECIKNMYASQNDFYRLVGLPINGFGEEFGWSTDVMLDIQFSAVLTEDKKPAIAIEYRMNPIRGYNSFG
jgi:hypothetical protein